MNYISHNSNTVCSQFLVRNYHYQFKLFYFFKTKKKCHYYTVCIHYVMKASGLSCFLYLWNFVFLTEIEESAPTKDVSRHFEDTSYGYKDFSRHGMHVPTFHVQVGPILQGFDKQQDLENKQYNWCLITPSSFGQLYYCLSLFEGSHRYKMVGRGKFMDRSNEEVILLNDQNPFFKFSVHYTR